MVCNIPAEGLKIAFEVGHKRMRINDSGCGAFEDGGARKDVGFDGFSAREGDKLRRHTN